jgi:hypothetical protein
MIDFPIDELLDDSICTIWLERHLHWLAYPPVLSHVKPAMAVLDSRDAARPARVSRCHARLNVEGGFLRRAQAAVCESGHFVRSPGAPLCEFHQDLCDQRRAHARRPASHALFKIVNLARGLLIAVAVLLIGLALLLAVVNQWRVADFDRLDYACTMRLVVPGVTLTALGVQTMLSSFFVSNLGVHRK